MKQRKTRFKHMVVLCLLAVFDLVTNAAEPLRERGPIEGSYIVVLKAPEAPHIPLPPEQVSRYVLDTAVELAARFRFEVTFVYKHALTGFLISGASELTARNLLADWRVDFVEQDRRTFLDPIRGAELTHPEVPPWGSPEGVHYGIKQPNPTWGLDRIDQRDLPLSGSYYYNTTATNVRVYIIDSGIRATHQEFGDRVLPGVSYIVDDFYGDFGSVDCNGHGTHVAGTIGGATYGVAKGVRLIPVRVVNCAGEGSTSLTIAGVDWVTLNHVLPAVANMSLLHEPPSPALDIAVKNLIRSGVVVTAAAGNEKANACHYSPGRVAGAITVGASTKTDHRWPSSNYGPCVDIFAPGKSVRSAWHTSDSDTRIGSGTSMAAPHVAGVAALWLSINPTWPAYQVRYRIYNRATPDRLSNRGPGSPDLLLYAR